MKNRIFTALLGLLLFLYLPFGVNAQAIFDNARETDAAQPAPAPAVPLEPPTADADAPPTAKEQPAPLPTPDADEDAPALAQADAAPTDAQPEPQQDNQVLRSTEPLWVTNTPALDEEIERVAASLLQLLDTLPDGARIKMGGFPLHPDWPSTFGIYWASQLENALVNQKNKRFIVITDPLADADYRLDGIMFAFRDSMRLFTSLTKLDDFHLLFSERSIFALTRFVQELLDITLIDEPPETPYAVPSEPEPELQDVFEPDSMDDPFRYLTLGEVIERVFHSYDEDFFLVTAPEDCVMDFEISSLFDTVMELFDADTGELLAQDDDGGRELNARIQYDAEAGKSYIVKLYGYEGEAGSYRFRIRAQVPLEDAAEPNDSVEQAVLVSVGEDVEAVFNSPDDVDWYRVDVVPGNTYLIVSTDGNLDTFITIYDEDGDALGEDDDSGYRGNALISVDISEHTALFIEVYEYDGNHGAYTLHTELMQAGAVDAYEPDDDVENSKEIAVGETQERTFTISLDIDNVRLTIAEAGVYEIRTIAADGKLDTYISLFDIATEDFLDENDSGGDNFDACLRIRLESGDYLISIFCMNDDPLADNAYTLSIIALSDEDD
jgi:hypothetical protein